MVHLTLNTGHVRESPRLEVGPGIVEALRPLIDAGGGQIPGASPWRCNIERGDGFATCNIFRGEESGAVLLGVAWDANSASALWECLETTYLSLGDAMGRAGILDESLSVATDQPKTVPWCAALILPGMAKVALSDAHWLGDFERCLAWALIESAS